MLCYDKCLHHGLWCNGSWHKIKGFVWLYLCHGSENMLYSLIVWSYITWFELQNFYNMHAMISIHDFSRRVLKWYLGWIKCCPSCDLAVQPGYCFGLRSDLILTPVQWECKGLQVFYYAFGCWNPRYCNGCFGMKLAREEAMLCGNGYGVWVSGLTMF